MGTHDEIIIPVPEKHPKSIGSRCAMVGNPMDIDVLCDLMQLPKKNTRRLLLSRLYYDHDIHPNFSLVGPFVGAPYAVILLETVVSWNIKEIVFWGWCGAVSPDIHIGDIIIPDMSFIDDGTSKNYIHNNEINIRPSQNLQDRLKTILVENNIQFHEGPVWSTDAIYRETPDKVKYYQKKNVLAVEMESSALFSAGHFRSIPVGCILVVSDEVSSFSWVKGFDNLKFKKSRQQAGEAIRDYLKDNVVSSQS